MPRLPPHPPPFPESRPFGRAVESSVPRLRSVCAAEPIPYPSGRSLPPPIRPTTLRQNRHSKKFAGRARRCIRRHRQSLFAEPVDDPQADDAQTVPDGVAAGRPGAAGPA